MNTRLKDSNPNPNIKSPHGIQILQVGNDIDLMRHIYHFHNVHIFVH